MKLKFVLAVALLTQVICVCGAQFSLELKSPKAKFGPFSDKSGTTMKVGNASFVVLDAGVADSIKLKSEKTGTVVGPFTISNGSRMKLGAYEFSIVTQEPASRATPEAVKPARNEAPQATKPAQSDTVKVALCGMDEADASEPAITQGRKLTDLAFVELVSDGSVELVERQAIQKVLDELGLGIDALANKANAVKVGKMLGANKLVLGAHFKSGEDKDMVAVKIVRSESSTIDEFTILSLESSDLEASAKVMAQMLKRSASSKGDQKAVVLGVGRFVQTGLRSYNTDMKSQILTYLMSHYAKNPGITLVERSDMDALLQEKHLIRRGFISTGNEDAITGVASVFISGSYETIRTDKTLISMEVIANVAGKLPFRSKVTGETPGEICQKVAQALDSNIEELGAKPKKADRQTEIDAQWNRIYAALNIERESQKLQFRPFDENGQPRIDFFVFPPRFGSKDQQQAVIEGFEAIALLVTEKSEIWEVAVQGLKRWAKFTDETEQKTSQARLQEMARSCSDPNARFLAGLVIWEEDSVDLPNLLEKKYHSFDVTRAVAKKRQELFTVGALHQTRVVSKQQYYDRLQKSYTQLMGDVVSVPNPTEKEEALMVELVEEVAWINFTDNSGNDRPERAKVRQAVMDAVPLAAPYILFKWPEWEEAGKMNVPIVQKQIEVLNALKAKKLKVWNRPFFLERLASADMNVALRWDFSVLTEYRKRCSLGPPEVCIDLLLDAIDFRLKMPPTIEPGRRGRRDTTLSDLNWPEIKAEAIDAKVMPSGEGDASGHLSPEIIATVRAHMNELQNRKLPDVDATMQRLGASFRQSDWTPGAPVTNQAFNAFADLWWTYNRRAGKSFFFNRPKAKDFEPDISPYVMALYCYDWTNNVMPVSEFTSEHRVDLYRALSAVSEGKRTMFDKPRFCSLFAECLRPKVKISPVVEHTSARVDQLLTGKQYDVCFALLTHFSGMMVGEKPIPGFASDRLNGRSPDQSCRPIASEPGAVIAGICSDLQGGAFVVTADGRVGEVKAESRRVKYYNIPTQILKRNEQPWAYQIASNGKKVWVRFHGGLCEVDPNTNSARKYGAKEGILVSYIGSMALDPEGKKLWLNTYENWDRNSGHYGRAINGYLDIEKESFVGCSRMNSSFRISAGSEGLLWFVGSKTDSSGLGAYSLGSNTSLDFTPNPHSAKAATTLGHRSSGEVFGIAAFADGVLMNADYGVLVYEPRLKTYSGIPVFPSIHISPNDQDVRKTDSFGNLGVATQEKRAWIFDMQRKTQIAQIESGNRITAVDASKDGVWLAVEKLGVYLLPATRMGVTLATEVLTKQPAAVEKAVKNAKPKIMVIPFGEPEEARGRGWGEKASDIIAKSLARDDANVRLLLGEEEYEVVNKLEVQKALRAAGVRSPVSLSTTEFTPFIEALDQHTDADYVFYGQIKPYSGGRFKLVFSIGSFATKLSGGGSLAGATTDYEENVEANAEKMPAYLAGYIENDRKNEAKMKEREAARDAARKEAAARTKPPSKPVAEQAAPSGPSLLVKAFIDGTDILKIKGTSIWYEHKDAALPGKWNGNDEPTYVNDQKWMPQWQGNSSKPFKLNSPHLPLTAGKDVSILKKSSKGVVSIKEQPSQKNGQTLAIQVEDPDGGARWIEFYIVL